MANRYVDVLAADQLPFRQLSDEKRDKEITSKRQKML